MTTTQAPRKAAEAHAADCREAIAAGRPRPLYAGLSLRHTDLRHADLCDADLRHADLRGADLRGADLRHADLCDADLRHADLRGADLRHADIRRANLRGADLRHADLRHTDLCHADIRHADLCDADLRRADLTGADLCGARVAEGEVIASVAGHDGGYYWHALALVGGGCVLQYGCDRATLVEWHGRGPEYGARHNRPPDHWATGPAVAIAAAEALTGAEAAEAERDALRARAEAALAAARAEGAAADALLSDGLQIVESLSGGYDVWCDAVRRRLTGGPVEGA